MAPAEHARLGADARLAARVCGARLRARTDVGDRRAPVSRQRRPYQRTDTRQAGAYIETNAAARAASRRGAQDPAASGRSCASAYRLHRAARHAGNHRHSA